MTATTLPLLTTCALVVALLSAALHVLIFYMEVISWEGALARKTFGGTPQEARPFAFYAYNQGFYNLFLAIEVVLGAVLTWCAGGSLAVAGLALAAFGCASMLGAALALAAKSSEHRLAALKQGTLPAVALALMLVSVAA